MQTTTPRLERGKMVPLFTLPSTNGDMISRSSYRGRKHLAIIMLPYVDLAARTYLEQLREHYEAVRAADSEILVVVSDAGSSAEGLHAALDLPFPLLLDAERSAATRFLPDGAPFGVFILDRYGALHAQWTLTDPPLPSPDEVVEWLTVVDSQCVL